MPNYVHGYVLYTTGLEAPMWYVQGRMVAVCTIGLGTWNSEFVLVVRSMADGLQETCGALWILIPTQMGFSHYNAFTETGRWTDTPMWIFVACLNPNQMQLANLRPRIICNN